MNISIAFHVLFMICLQLCINASDINNAKAFAILGFTDIRPTESQIHSAYRSLSLRYHPDKCRSPDCQAKFIELNDAYSRVTQYCSDACLHLLGTITQMLKSHPAESHQILDGFAKWYNDPEFFDDVWGIIHSNKIIEKAYPRFIESLRSFIGFFSIFTFCTFAFAIIGILATLLLLYRLMRCILSVVWTMVTFPVRLWYRTTSQKKD